VLRELANVLDDAHPRAHLRQQVDGWADLAPTGPTQPCRQRSSAVNIQLVIGVAAFELSPHNLRGADRVHAPSTARPHLLVLIHRLTNVPTSEFKSGH
jgi:hypothetical protein